MVILQSEISIKFKRMDGQFITNKELILSDIINSILPKCDNAYFLVGYFYFSGFAELCDKLKDVNLKSPRWS